MDRFANASTAFGLTISLIKVLAQETTFSKMTINNYKIENVDKFSYLYAINKQLSIDKELDIPIGVAASSVFTCALWNTCAEKSPTFY